MPETDSVAADLSAPDDLISFLRAIPVGVSLLRRSWPLPAWGALPAVVPAVGRGAGDPQRLQELPRSGGIRQSGNVTCSTRPSA